MVDGEDSAAVTFDDGTKMGVDYSGRAGVPGIFVCTKGRMDSGFSVNFHHQSVNGIQVMTISETDQHPVAVADGDGIKLGGLHIEIVNDVVVFSDAATPHTAMYTKTLHPNDEPALVDPGAPDALLSFDYEDVHHSGGRTFLKEQMGSGVDGMAYNTRADHFVDGLFGEAFPIRGEEVDSILPWSIRLKTRRRRTSLVMTLGS